MSKATKVVFTTFSYTSILCLFGILSEIIGIFQTCFDIGPFIIIFIAIIIHIVIYIQQAIKYRNPSRLLYIFIVIITAIVTIYLIFGLANLLLPMMHIDPATPTRTHGCGNWG